MSMNWSLSITIISSSEASGYTFRTMWSKSWASCCSVSPRAFNSRPQAGPKHFRLVVMAVAPLQHFYHAEIEGTLSGCQVAQYLHRGSLQTRDQLHGLLLLTPSLYMGQQLELGEVALQRHSCVEFLRFPPRLAFLARRSDRRSGGKRIGWQGTGQADGMMTVQQVRLKANTAFRLGSLAPTVKVTIAFLLSVHGLRLAAHWARQMMLGISCDTTRLHHAQCRSAASQRRSTHVLHYLTHTQRSAGDPLLVYSSPLSLQYIRRLSLHSLTGLTCSS